MIALVPADRRDLALDAAFAGELSVRELAAIARKTDSNPGPVSGLCPWCDDFNPLIPSDDATHGMCPTCKARFDAQLDALEASR